MKKAKVLLATAAMATAFTCGLGMTACDDGNSTDTPKNEQIAAVYSLYAANAQENGETVLTYEQWLESIKGEKGATGATGATGKSAYDIAKDNGFEGTEEEWLESLKGANGSAGAAGAAGTAGVAGKSAYDIAKDNGFEGTEAEWLESLKGVGVEGVYETSEGTMVKYTDGTVKPIRHDGVENILLKLGDNQLELPVAPSKMQPSETEFNFYLLSNGRYEMRFCIDLIVQYTSNSILPNGNVSEGGGTYDPYKKPVAGQWEDGTNYYAVQFNVLAGYANNLTIKNCNTTQTSFRFTIVKVEDEQ